MADHGGSMWPHVLLSSKSCRVCWINLNILYLLLDKDCRSAYPQDIAHGLQPRELAASRNCMRLLSCTSLQKILHSKSIIWLHQRVHPRHIKHCFLCPSWTSNRPVTSLTLQTGFQAIAQRHCETGSWYCDDNCDGSSSKGLLWCNTRRFVLCNDSMRPVQSNYGKFLSRAGIAIKTFLELKGYRGYLGIEKCTWGGLPAHCAAIHKNDAIPILQNVLAVLPLQSNHFQWEVVQKRQKILPKECVSECQCYW